MPERNGEGTASQINTITTHSGRPAVVPVGTGISKSQDYKQYHSSLLEALRREDEQVSQLLQREYDRRQDTLQLIAAGNHCSQAVLAALGSVFQDKTAEGIPGQRWHGGCEVVDEIESLATERAKNAFGAHYANVQLHSGSTANHVAFSALLEPGDRILSLCVESGGHPSHGGSFSVAQNYFQLEQYSVSPETSLFDMDAIRERARVFRPKLIMCGASAYPRQIDFTTFRAIADEVGAFLLADISHIAGLVVAGLHPSPIDEAHVTTTSTYKAGGPRGGLILLGEDYNTRLQREATTVTLQQAIERAVFPGVQGTPYFNHIAAKAVFFSEMVSVRFRNRQKMIIENAKRLADVFEQKGYDVLTGGTDNHMVLVNLKQMYANIDGEKSQRLLEKLGLIVDAYRLPSQPAHEAHHGIRVGTAIATARGMSPIEMDELIEIIDTALQHLDHVSGEIDQFDCELASELSRQIKTLCARFRL